MKTGNMKKIDTSSLDFYDKINDNFDSHRKTICELVDAVNELKEKVDKLETVAYWLTFYGKIR